MKSSDGSSQSGFGAQSELALCTVIGAIAAIFCCGRILTGWRASAGTLAAGPSYEFEG